MSGYRIWCNQQLNDEAQLLLETGVGVHRLVWSQVTLGSNLQVPRRDPAILDCDIAFGQPDPMDIIAAPRLRWVHVSAAGYTRYDREDLRQALRQRDGMLSNSSSVYADPCAQHVLAMMLGGARQLPVALRAQQARSWDHGSQRAATRVLSGQTALIVGLGAIGKRLIDLLRPFALTVNAVRRSVRGDEPVKTVTMDQIESLLPGADHVIDLLPAGTHTLHFFNARRFTLMKAGAWFYNVGRGDTVDQQALVESLNAARLAGAYLDVTAPEPLPADHPLWTTPNCFITPHIAGGHQAEHRRLVEHFLSNLQRFEHAAPLLDRIA